MKTSDNSSLSGRISEALKSALAELEELQVQMALGKLEAKDYFESVKKSVREEINLATQRLNQLKQQPGVLEVLNAFEHLQVQLSLGLAETEDAFTEQKKRILEELHKLEAALDRDSSLKEEFSQAKLAAEKLKLKLELLTLKYRLKKVEAEFHLGKYKDQLRERFENIRHNLEQKEKQAEDRWEHFRTEIGNAFGHIRKAFEN